MKNFILFVLMLVSALAHGQSASVPVFYSPLQPVNVDGSAFFTSSPVFVSWNHKFSDCFSHQKADATIDVTFAVNLDALTVSFMGKSYVFRIQRSDDNRQWYFDGLSFLFWSESGSDRSSCKISIEFDQETYAIRSWRITDSDHRLYWTNHQLY